MASRTPPALTIASPTFVVRGLRGAALLYAESDRFRASRRWHARICVDLRELLGSHAGDEQRPPEHTAAPRALRPGSCRSVSSRRPQHCITLRCRRQNRQQSWSRADPAREPSTIDRYENELTKTAHRTSLGEAEDETEVQLPPLAEWNARPALELFVRGGGLTVARFEYCQSVLGQRDSRAPHGGRRSPPQCTKSCMWPN